MKHIKSTGCGFSLTGARSITEYEDNKWYYGGTYNCQGTTELNAAFQHTTITVGGNFYDNYYNLPQKIKGFIMTLSPVIPMDTVANPNVLVVPETSCVNDFDLTDPASTDYYKLYGDPKLYVSINGSTYGGSEAMWNQEYTTDDAVYELNPGALEPMIDTAFPPVGVDNITFDDVQYTGGFILDRLNNSWRTMIQGQINTLYNRSSTSVMDWSGINGLFNLLNSDEQQSECANFRISQHNPAILPVVEGTVDWTPDRTYDVSEGTVYIDGTEVEVEGVTAQYVGLSMEFYLDITPASGDTPVSAEILTCIAGGLELDRWPDHVYEFIGSVNRIVAPAKPREPFKTNRSYTMFKITQGDCLTDITLSGGTGGPSITEEYEYEGPYKLYYAGLATDTDPESTEKSGFGVIGTDTDIDDDAIPQAGRIYECGEATGWGPEADGIATGDVFVFLQGGSVLGYGQTTPEIEDEETPIYTIRLGNVSFDPSPVDIPVGGTTVAVQASALVPGLIVVPPQEWIPAVPTTGTTITELTRGAGEDFVYQVSMLIDGSTAGTAIAKVLPVIKQYHTGDIYLDTECQEVNDYLGPFRVTATTDDPPKAHIETFESSSDSPVVNYAGRVVYLSGTSVTSAEPVPVPGNDITANAGSYIYAHVRFQKGSTTTTQQLYTYLDTDFNAQSSPTAAVPTGSTVAKVYTIRLAQFSSTTNDIIQIQHGDIYLGDISEPLQQQSPGKYRGPFTLDDSGVVHCPVCPQENIGGSTVDVAGYYSVNGTGYVPVRETTVEISGTSTRVFLNVSGSTGATIETTPCSTPDCYSVWLGLISAAASDITVGSTTYTRDTEKDTTVSNTKYYGWTNSTLTLYTRAEVPQAGATLYTITSGSVTTYGSTVTAVISSSEADQMQYGNVHVDGRWS